MNEQGTPKQYGLLPPDRIITLKDLVCECLTCDDARKSIYIRTFGEEKLRPVAFVEEDSKRIVIVTQFLETAQTD